MRNPSANRDTQLLHTAWALGAANTGAQNRLLFKHFEMKERNISVEGRCLGPGPPPPSFSPSG